VDTEIVRGKCLVAGGGHLGSRRAVVGILRLFWTEVLVEGGLKDFGDRELATTSRERIIAATAIAAIAAITGVRHLLVILTP